MPIASYVYLHKRKDTGIVFYIGKGSGTRDTKCTSRSKEWKRIVKEANGFTVTRIYDNLFDDEALYLETIYLKNPEASWQLINSYRNTIAHKIDKQAMDQYFYYDESSPTCLRWKCWNRSRIKKNSRHAGDVAGYANTCEGYRTVKGMYSSVKINGKAALVHRLIWVIHYGEIPDGMVINHKDNNSLNNKISNLELITQAQNSQRTKSQKKLDCGLSEYVANKIYYYAKAVWNDSNGKRKTKFFPYIKYGKQEAFRLATEARNQALAELNTRGAGYLL